MNGLFLYQKLRFLLFDNLALFLGNDLSFLLNYNICSFYRRSFFFPRSGRLGCSPYPFCTGSFRRRRFFSRLFRFGSLFRHFFQRRLCFLAGLARLALQEDNAQRRHGQFNGLFKFMIRCFFHPDSPFIMDSAAAIFCIFRIENFRIGNGIRNPYQVMLPCNRRKVT